MAADPGPRSGFGEALGTVLSTHVHEGGDQLPGRGGGGPGDQAVGGDPRTERGRTGAQERRVMLGVFRVVPKLEEGPAGQGGSCHGCGFGERAVCLTVCLVD